MQIHKAPERMTRERFREIAAKIITVYGKASRNSDSTCDAELAAVLREAEVDICGVSPEPAAPETVGAETPSAPPVVDGDAHTVPPADEAIGCAPVSVAVTANSTE